MIANINKDPKHSDQHGYSDFPMRQAIHTSMSVGEIMPAYIDVLSPGDKVDGTFNLNSRLLYLERPANEEIELHCDTFFVPIQQLFKPFEQVFYGISDFETDFIKPETGRELFPSASFNAIIDSQIVSERATKEFKNVNLEYVSRVKLFDALQYPVKALADEMLKPVEERAPSLARSTSIWFALAYQKIWYDHYRLTDRIGNDAQAYNCDSWFNTGAPFASIRVTHIFDPHLVPYNRDYFTHNFTSPLVSAGSSAAAGNGESLLASVDLGKVDSWLGTQDFRTVGVVASNNGSRTTDPQSSSSFAPSGVAPKVTSNSTLIYNTANIRAAFAVEKLLEVTRRAGKHYDKQTLAHFGVEVPKGTAGECFKIDEFTQPIVIGDIVASATTGDGSDGSSVLGELGGRGYTDTKAFNLNPHFNFEAKTHGILMSVVYFKPRCSYQQTGFNRLNKLLNRTDFFIPEFENLGMQPLFSYEALLDTVGVEGISILGWKYRYSEFKEKYDITRGAYLGDMSDWSSSRIFAESDAFGEAPSYYVQPDYLNPILSVQYGVGARTVANYGAWNRDQGQPVGTGAENYAQLYGQDPFVCDFFFYVKKVSKMSVYGLPNL